MNWGEESKKLNKKVEDIVLNTNYSKTLICKRIMEFEINKFGLKDK